MPITIAVEVLGRWKKVDKYRVDLAVVGVVFCGLWKSFEGVVLVQTLPQIGVIEAKFGNSKIRKFK